MEIIDKFNKYIFKTYDIQITKCLTISRLGLEILLKNYLPDDGNSKLPLINKKDVFKFIKEGYYGGITEVYIPYGENLLYYDVNSEYPFCAKNPMPGNISTYIEDFTGKGLKLEELFGYFYCKVKTKKGYLGLLPLHMNGSLILPNGEFYGTWFSEELKLAKKNGYEITVLKGYNFNKVENVFDKFVDELYEIRRNSTGLVKSITKMLLNSPFGRLGMSIDKPITKIVNKNDLDFILSCHEVKSFIELNENRFLITYDSEISKNICEKYELDYIKILNKNKKDIENNIRFDDVSISTAAAITSYARIYMNKIKLEIIKKGGKIYYMDTDSIVTNIVLPKRLLGKNLGQLKLEHRVKKAYFISGKTYCLLLYNEQIIKKAKGVFSHSLTLNDYENMYLHNKDVFAIKGNTKIDYKKGTVNIKDKKALLRYNAYTKRIKIYNKKGLWINTKPITLKE
jgi:hypothetical protein